MASLQVPCLVLLLLSATCLGGVAFLGRSFRLDLDGGPSFWLYQHFMRAKMAQPAPALLLGQSAPTGLLSPQGDEVVHTKPVNNNHKHTVTGIVTAFAGGSTTTATQLQVPARKLLDRGGRSKDRDRQPPRFRPSSSHHSTSRQHPSQSQSQSSQDSQKLETNDKLSYTKATANPTATAIARPSAGAAENAGAQGSATTPSASRDTAASASRQGSFAGTAGGGAGGATAAATSADCDLDPRPEGLLC